MNKGTTTIELPILDDVDQMEVVNTFNKKQLWYVCAIAKAFEKSQQELQRKDNEINDLKSSIADYQEAVGDYQDELKRKDNIIKDAKEVLLTTNNIEKALNVLDKIEELENGQSND